MVTRTFLDKCTTIISNSPDNFGLNPIGMLNYGGIVSRCLLHFDIEKIKSMAEDVGYENIRHFLNLTNCGSIDTKDFDVKISSSDGKGEKQRTSSFTIIALTLPCEWDAGVGFDSSDDFWFVGKTAVSRNGANWFQSANGFPWTVPGVYTREEIDKEYEAFKNAEQSKVVAMQHFDYGNENFHLDITDYVNSVISGESENNGLMLAFIPAVESLVLEHTQYVGFFTNNTNTFFVPCVESRCEDAIKDSRKEYYSGMPNKLYFLANIAGSLTDLDNIPTCTVEKKTYPVKRQRKGVYYAEVNATAKENAILYDTWGNLSYKGEKFDDVEDYFAVRARNSFITSTRDALYADNAEPTLSGMNDNEKVSQGDERQIEISFRIPYVASIFNKDGNTYYRIYVKDGAREIDVIDWDITDKFEDKFYFKINSGELLPQTYYVDIKTFANGLTRIFKDKLHFKIVNNITEIKK